MHYTDDLIIVDITFIEGCSKETRLEVNTRVVAASCARIPTTTPSVCL
jgi:hypothetical protein